MSKERSDIIDHGDYLEKLMQYRIYILILLVQVHVDVVVIESDDVATAVAEEVAKGAITKLVVGASSHGLFKRYLLKC